MQAEGSVGKVAGGDFKSIEKICEQTWEDLYRFIYSKVQNREEAEEITQETYIKAISYIQKGDVQIENCTGFLKTVSLNILRDRWRKKMRRPALSSLDEGLWARADSVSKTIEERVWIESALNTLSCKQRTVLVLRIIEGYSVRETAKRMQIKEAAVRVLQYRALKHLAKIMKEEGLL